MRAALLALVTITLVTGCGDQDEERRAELRQEAELRAAVMTDCRLVVPALARARDLHARALDRQDFERTAIEIEVLTARARTLDCPVLDR